MPKKVYNEVILLNKVSLNYNPTKAENDGNTRLVPITDRQGINDESTKHFKRYTASRVLSMPLTRFKNSWTVVETPSHQSTSSPKISPSKSIEGEITLSERNHTLFKKIKGNSASGIDGFTFNWFRKFWDTSK